MSENRLSQSLENPAQGNAQKYDRYREAWSRIKKAQKNKFFLEAITIEESIISDRLSSYLRSQEVFFKKAGFASLGALIKEWEKLCPEPIKIDEIENLQAAVRVWKGKRNNAVHAIVKFRSEQDEIDVDEFLKNAKSTAEEGETIAKAVQKWKRQASQ